MKDLLPIGSVVTLKEGTKRLMIIGRLQQNVRTKKVYDYAGCLWPEGYMDKDSCYVFDHEDIDCLYYIGLQDIEEFNFRFELDEMRKKTSQQTFVYWRFISLQISQDPVQKLDTLDCLPLNCRIHLDHALQNCISLSNIQDKLF